MLRAARLWLVVVLVPIGLASASIAVAQDPEPVIYTVQEGDTLYSIARTYGLTVEVLAAANGLEDTGLISVGQELVIPILQPEPTAKPRAEASEAGPIYVVQPGDTLSAIAERFATTVELLVSVNGITDPSLIEVGQKLVIPTAHPELVPRTEAEPYSRLHVVRAGELLPSLALRYGTTVWELGEINGLGRLGLLLLGQSLDIPAPLASHAGMPHFPRVTARPSPVGQGQTMIVEVEASDALSLTASFLGQAIPFVPGENGYWSVVGVDALTPSGRYVLSLTAIEGSTGDRLTMQESYTVTAGSFGTYNILVPTDRQGLLDPTLSRAESEIIGVAFAGRTQARLWEGVFGFPLEGELRVTAQFGQRRSYSGGPVSSYHSGLDYGADKGTPVLAPARGAVVLAEKLDVRGKAVILDHGLGVFSGFWHLSLIDVEVGQSVEKGEVVGLVGNSGLSTGPHLHWEMRVLGVPVNPVQWTQRAFP